MEWVETTAKTVEEAKETALDRLGIDADEAEFEVLEEPKAGLFGRMRGEARVRARVAPRAPRPKQDRRERRRSTDRKRGGGQSGGDKPDVPTPETEVPGGVGPEPSSADAKAPASMGTQRYDAASGEQRKPRKRSGTRASSQGRSAGDGNRQTPKTPRDSEENDEAPVTITLDEQTQMAEEFLSGLLDAFGIDGTLTSTRVDDETAEVDIAGDDLGLLIGPRGQTISALQELTRTVLQRRAGGSYEGRVRVDVSGYRQRRREALVRFTQDVAEQVRSSGRRKALEPMNAADRKVVHDTANEIEGVRTVSEGEEPRRWVVVVPED